MTNEELKKKISQIIADYFCSQRNEHKNLWGDDRLCYSKMNFAECERVTECTDALIEAEIGDVKEAVKDFAKKITVLINGTMGIGRADFWKGYNKAKYDVIEIIKQAEKELAEEVKDDL